MDKIDRVIEALYTLYGGSSKPIIIGTAATKEGAISSIEIREDGSRITELYEEGNTTNLAIEMGIVGVDLLKGIDFITNGKKGFNKVITGAAGSFRVKSILCSCDKPQ